MSVLRVGDCRVRRLQLRVSDDAARTRGALLVEDALRTASLHAGGLAGSRMLIVRSLALGAIRADGASSAVALAFEERVRELATQAVSVRDPSAAGAAAVFFDDPAHALAMLAARLAARARVDEWFWRLAVPSWNPELPRADALRSILAAALDLDMGVLGAAHVVREVAAHGGVHELMSALRWEDGRTLLRRSGWTLDAAGALMPVRAPPLRVNALHQQLMTSWVQQMGAEDARVCWLAAMLAITEQPARAADSTLVTRVHVLLRSLEHPSRHLHGSAHEKPAAESAVTRAAPDERPATAKTAARESPARMHELSPAAPAPAAIPPQAQPAEAGLQSHPLQASSAETSPAARAIGDAARAQGGAQQTSPAPANDMGATLPARSAQDAQPLGRLAQTPDAAPGSRNRISALRARHDSAPQEGRTAVIETVATHNAGLFYLLPLLRRVGMGALLENDPALLELEFATRVLRHIAVRAGAQDDDPVLAILPCPAVDEATAAALAPRLAEWTTTLRRWTHRHADMGLVALVRRPGTLTATRTHLDVSFSLRQVDLRIRKAGLDIDPGWLPWFGRVVHFHYTSEGLRHV